MALIPTTAWLSRDTSVGHTFTRLEVGSGNRAVPADVEGGWDVDSLLTPFNPVREKTNPPGDRSGAVQVVDWQDGSEGDAVTYAANEVGLFATPDGGNEFLAFYESNDMGAVFTKTAGSVYLRRLRIQATGAELANATFNVSLSAPSSPDASETAKGLVELADNSEVDAVEANASAEKVPSIAKLWRWFTGARIVARLTALTGNNKLPYSALRGTPTETEVHTTQTSYDNASDSDDKLHVLAL